MPLYEYRCLACDGRTEALRPESVRTILCACGEVATRESVYAVAQIGVTRTPVAERRTSLREYREASEQINYEQAKAEESAQQPLPRVNHWAMAKARAGKLMAAGVSDSLDL